MSDSFLHDSDASLHYSARTRPVDPPVVKSLRDEFAGQAMQGLLASRPDGWMNSELCREAYLVADQMLIERKL